MPRPCAERHPVPQSANCRMCYLFSTDDSYNRLWGGAGIGDRPVPSRLSLPCRHLGAPTGETLPCQACGGKVDVPVRGCAVHGECVAESKLVKREGGAYLANCRCPKYEPATEDTVQVEVTADGIGDAILGLTVVGGLTRDRPERRVVYSCRGAGRRGAPWQVPWASLFEGADLVTAELLPGVPTLRPHDTYAAQNAERLTRPRWEHYARACGTRAVLPWPRPLPADALAWAERYRGSIVLAPWSGWARPGSPSWLPNNRVWLPSHWLALESLLLARGRRVAVIDNVAERNSIFSSEKVIGAAPERVAALLALSDCVVGNDSGMAHVAGALRVPCVALCGPVRGQKLFGIYPTVRAIDGPLSCSGCHWQGAHGWQPRCDTICASLQMIHPADVLSAVEQIAAPPPGYLPGQPALDRCLGAEVSRLTAPHFERRHTMAAFLQHVASRPAPLVVETGCQRADDDYGAGMSTTLFARLLASHGGQLLSVDSSRANVAFARSRTHGLPVEVVESDSRPWLRARMSSSIDALYLDSADVGTPDYEACCLAEAETALPRLAPGAPILIDDTRALPSGDAWGGKGALAVPWLLSRGWRVEASGHQVLLAPPASALASAAR